MMRRGCAAVLLGLLALVGCSDSGGSEGAPSTAPGAMTVEEAGARYLELVEPVFCAAAAVDEAAGAVPTDSTVAEARRSLQPPAATAAEAYDDFIAGAQDADWPPVAETAAAEAIEQAQADAARYRALGEAADDAEFRAAYLAMQQAATAEGPRPPGSLRAALGITDDQQDTDC